jgi:pyrroline-5-carboxylate reductase
MKIAIIGAGNMGGAIARGLCKGTVIACKDIVLSNRSVAKLDAIKAEHPAIAVTCNNREAARDAHMIILAVKPWLIKEVIDEIQPTREQVVVSVAAGIDFASLDAMLPQRGNTIFRLIPNTAISLQESLTLISSHNATAEQEQLMLDIFNEMGVAMLIPESQMSAATSMTSSGIAYALKYIQAAMQAGVELGIYPHDAMKMVAQSMKGAAELILQKDTHPSVEIDKVCTPRGYTIKGINTLESHGFTTAIIEAIKSSCS